MMNSTMISYTPIEELPMPPKFMLDELEEEITKYNTFLMSQILTIKEAKPIRLALREKFQTHPIAKLIKEQADNKSVFHFIKRYKWKNDEYDYSNVPTDKKPTFGYTIVGTLNTSNVPSRVLTLPEYYQNQMKIKSGDKKGVFRYKLVTLAHRIISHWKSVVGGCNRNQSADHFLRKGFYKFFEENWENNKKLPKDSWHIN